MNPILYGVMVYEDASLAKLAKEGWDHMVQALDTTFDFELRLWKFDVLRIPEWRNAAVNDAARAQLVFVVTHGAGELPSEVKTWIEEWLALMDREQENARLLTFLFKLGASAFSQFAYLQQAARRGSMDFIASPALALNQPSVMRLHAPSALLRSREDPSNEAAGARRRQAQVAKRMIGEIPHGDPHNAPARLLG